MSKGQICAAVEGGATTIGELKACTKAGATCGGCVPLVTQVMKFQMAKLGMAVNNHICEHFPHSRQELYHLVRVGGKDVEGAFVTSGPAVIPEQLPANHPSKALAADFVAKYEKAYGAGSRNQFGGHAYDAIVVLEKVVPVALKKAKPGTKEFRAALRDAIEGMGRTVFAHGVMNWTKDDHWGYTLETGVMLTVKNGDWALAN